MDAKKRKRLEAAGWRIGTVAEFLGLSAAEEALVEMHIALADLLRAERVRHGLTQAEVARRMQSSQSRVAKMEQGDPTVSMELLMRAVLVAGASRRAVAAALTKRVA